MLLFQMFIFIIIVCYKKVRLSPSNNAKRVFKVRSPESPHCRTQGLEKFGNIVVYIGLPSTQYYPTEFGGCLSVDVAVVRRFRFSLPPKKNSLVFTLSNNVPYFEN